MSISLSVETCIALLAWFDWRLELSTMIWIISGYGRRGSVAGIPVFTIWKDVSAIDIVSIQRQNYANRFACKSLSARYSQSLQMGRLFIYAFSPYYSSTCPEIHINISSFPQLFPTTPIFIHWLLCVYVSQYIRWKSHYFLLILQYKHRDAWCLGGG